MHYGYSYVYPHSSYNATKSTTWLKRFPQYNRKLGVPKGYAKKKGYVYTRSFEYLDIVLDIENKTAELRWK